MDRANLVNLFSCRLCGVGPVERNELIEHLKADHEPLEIISFAAITMIDEESRNASALEFNRRFSGLKRIIGE